VLTIKRSEIVLRECDEELTVVEVGSEVGCAHQPNGVELQLKINLIFEVLVVLLAVDLLEDGGGLLGLHPRNVIYVDPTKYSFALG
jgi:hypothetical protein